MKPACWLACVALLAGAPAAAEEYSFDASSFARKPFEFSGQADLKTESFRLNRDGAFYKLNFYDKLQQPASSDRTTLMFKPAVKLRFGEDSTASFRAHLESQQGSLGDSRASRFDEAYFSHKFAPGLSVDAGKVALKWGKGYAWSPVGFVERAKDPNDPELAREGYTVLSADYIRNFDGPLQTLALTPVLLPVTANVNNDFGRSGHLNAAGRLYMLFMDTDIDLMFLNSGSRTHRYGLDFSRNLGTNFEVHGEWARVADAQRQITDSRGNVTTQQSDVTNQLLGMRYLSERETTYILEYYRNGSGYSAAQNRDFYELVDNGMNQFTSSGLTTLLRKANSLAQGQYGRPSAGQRYLYFRASQKEPWDILYFTPAVTLMANLDDRSFSVTPEVVYTGITNVQLQARLYMLGGGSRTDFGEKQNARRLELWARIYF